MSTGSLWSLSLSGSDPLRDAIQSLAQPSSIQSKRSAWTPPSSSTSTLRKSSPLQPSGTLCPGKGLIEFAIIADAKPSLGVKRAASKPPLDERQKRQAVASLQRATDSSSTFQSMELPEWDDDDHEAIYRAAAAPNELAPHAMDAAIEEALDLACADRRRGRSHTGVKAWFAFHAQEGSSPNRPIEPSAPLWVKLREEQRAMRFVCALVEIRGISVRSARNYWSAVQGWHAREFGVKVAAGMKLERLPQMLKGLTRKHGTAPRKLRRGINAKLLREAMDLLYPRDDPAAANMRAALSVAFQALLRSQEFAYKPSSSKKKWDAQFGLARADIKELNEQRLRLMIWAAKNTEHIGGKSCPVVIGAGGKYIDSVAEMANLMRVDPLRADDDPAAVPLFRKPGTHEPITYEDVLHAIRAIVRLSGEDPSEFGTHSLRIGGATALFSAGADMTTIRTLGRWSSDIYHLYVRACFEKCCSWTQRAGSVELTDVEGTVDEVDYY